MSTRVLSEGETIRELGQRIQNKFSRDDIRDIYRIIHLLLKLLTEDEHYRHQYNKHHIVMTCLHRFYSAYPNGYTAVHSYHAYVSEKLNEIKKMAYEKKRAEEDRTSCRCTIL